MERKRISKDVDDGLFFIEEVKQQIGKENYQDAKNKIDLAMAFFSSAKKHIEEMFSEIKENRFVDE